MEILLQNDFNNFLSEEYKNAILKACEIAEKHNVLIFLIGGIVRDLIMQNPIKDIDITVIGNAIEFAKYLENEADFKIISTQENLKTAKVQYINGVEIDFASTREEYYPIAGNLPEIKNFGCNLQDDVKRRDFTINTLAIALTGNKKFCLIDYFNGYEDIKNKKIKILHNNSFIDDPSRIVRALKFMVRFNFEIDEETMFLMQEYLKTVNVSMPLERIKNEFKQYFSIENEHLYEKVISTDIYKLVSDNYILNFNTDYLKEIEQYNLYNNENKWFIYFLLLIFKSDFANERLNLNSYEKKSVNDLKELYFTRIKNDNYEIYKNMQNKTDLAIAAYYVITGSNNIVKYLTELKQIKPIITGDDLIKLGLTPSPLFNEIFEKILKAKLDGNLKTKEEETAFVKNQI